ncbi:MAG: hypothetical protein IIA45_09125 [Bacteroidetes bacterium]|nr:hypothetical protein [Bacteroidota bacterium]
MSYRDAFFSLFILVITISGCRTSYQSENFDQYSWIIGSWMHETEGELGYEKWWRQDEDNYAGIGYEIIGGDTLVFEDLFIRRTENHVEYIAVVKDQNEGEPIRFRMISLNPYNLQFENYDHDFPQRINYLRYANDDSIKIFVRLEGKVRGEVKNLRFTLNQVK